MISTNDIDQLGGASVYGPGGQKLGSVGQFYLDDQTGQPEWVTVKTGLFGAKESFVPLAQAQSQSDGLTVPYDKEMVKGAPVMDADGHLSEQDEAALYRYYGLDAGAAYGTTTDVRSDRRADLTGRGEVDGAMTRSEEHLVVGTQQVETGKVRLRKHVVTETQQIKVPVSHEEARIEREPITDANRAKAYDGPEITEAEHEITLKAEKPVVGVETEAVERVRVGKQTVTETETVSGQVRKEQIELDDPTATSSKTRKPKH